MGASARLPSRSGRERRPPVPFIVGTGRCGSTLLRRMLNSHPNLAIPNETNFLAPLTLSCRLAPSPLAAFVDGLLKHPTFDRSEIDPEMLRRRVAELNPFRVSDGLRAFYKLHAELRGKTRWGDKTPAHYRNMPLIQMLFPEARFIHLIRDGRDTALSILDLAWGPKSIEQAAHWWLDVIRTTRELSKDVPHYIEVRYEDIINNTEETLKEILDFAEMHWHPSMLEYYKRPSAHRRWSPPDRSCIGRWRTKMNDVERRTFERLAGDLLHELGYETEHEPQAFDSTLVQSERSWFEERDRAITELTTLIPPKDAFILIDEEQWALPVLVSGRWRIPFPERDGTYNGPPADGDAALLELRRLQHAGINHVAVGRPAFWWLDHYSELHRYLCGEGECVLRNDRLVVFDLLRNLRRHLTEPSP